MSLRLSARMLSGLTTFLQYRSMLDSSLCQQSNVWNGEIVRRNLHRRAILQKHGNVFVICFHHDAFLSSRQRYQTRTSTTLYLLRHARLCNSARSGFLFAPTFLLYFSSNKKKKIKIRSRFCRCRRLILYDVRSIIYIFLIPISYINYRLYLRACARNER